MTTAKTPRVHEPGFQLPEPEKSQDEKMTANRHLSLTGGAHALIHHLGKPETTVVGCDLYLAPVPPALLGSMSGLTYPDLFIAFDADPTAYLGRNGYVISEQGKPPDFILEVASRSTGRRGHHRQASRLRSTRHPRVLALRRDRRVPRRPARRRPTGQRLLRAHRHRTAP